MNQCTTSANSPSIDAGRVALFVTEQKRRPRRESFARRGRFRNDFFKRCSGDFTKAWLSFQRLAQFWRRKCGPRTDAAQTLGSESLSQRVPVMQQLDKEWNRRFGIWTDSTQSHDRRSQRLLRFVVQFRDEERDERRVGGTDSGQGPGDLLANLRVIVLERFDETGDRGFRRTPHRTQRIGRHLSRGG